MKNRSRYETGLYAEALCRLCLRLKGYSILSSRFRTKLGEIDLIAARGNVIAIVEVKARTSVAEAAEAISTRQRERLSSAAALYIAKNPRFSGHAVRFDAMLVVPWRWPKHIENAW